MMKIDFSGTAGIGHDKALYIVAQLLGQVSRFYIIRDTAHQNLLHPH